MTDRIAVEKTPKLYVNGAFVRSESGRTVEVIGASGAVIAHACHASRKDLRDAVTAARSASEPWRRRTGYNRGQILYRIAEMLEGRVDELAKAIATPTGSPARTARKQAELGIDRLVAWAGWCDKAAQILGCQNPVAGPYYNFTAVEPTGVVAAVCPDTPSFLGMISLVGPVLAGANTAIVIASAANPFPATILAECCATGDVPPGVVNILTGDRTELASWIAGHRGIDAVHGADLAPDLAATLRAGASENVKRVRIRTVGPAGWADDATCQSLWWLEGLVEMKTIWHPAGI
jgi:acyl-CoA reductase-like NAD-dependent aldehyde dehydrogenase